MANESTRRALTPDDAHIERQLVEFRLQERERFLRTLISNLPGIVYRCRTDEHWTPEFMSDGVEILGYTAEDFIGANRVTWDEVIHPEDRERVRAEIRQLARESVPFSSTTHLMSYRVIAASQELKHIRDRFRFVYNPEGKAIALEGVMTDITELTLADERVRESDARYRLLAENMNDMVCLHDLDGMFLYLSPSCKQVLGFEPEELVGTNPYDLFHPKDVSRIREQSHQLLLAGQLEVMNEYRMRRKSGEYVWLETMSQRVMTEQGELLRLLTCSRDITNRKIAEDERRLIEEERAALLVREQTARREAEIEREAAERAREAAMYASRIKDEFLQMVSHEFRTPLTTIKAASRVLLNATESPEERREYLETISTECDRQIDMIINLLDVSRLEESGVVDLKHEAVKLSEVLRSCERIEHHAAAMREQSLSIDYDAEDLPAVRGDAKALRRALCTIIENAIKYTPKGGCITVAAELLSTTEIAVHIRDNGRGIRPEDLPHIFDKFYRGQNSQDPTIDGTPDDAVMPETPGVGLGLYLAERLISALDGHIEVESTLQQGSRFTVVLPVWNHALHERDAVDEYEFEEGT